MSRNNLSVSDPVEQPAESMARRAFDCLDRMLAVILISGNLVFLLFAFTAGAAQCAATASLIDDPDMLAGLTTVARAQCAVSPAVRALTVLFAGNALFISGIFVRQTPVRLQWRWLPRKKQESAATNPAAAPLMNGQTSSQITQ